MAVVTEAASRVPLLTRKLEPSHVIDDCRFQIVPHTRDRVIVSTHGARCHCGSVRPPQDPLDGLLAIYRSYGGCRTCRWSNYRHGGSPSPVPQLRVACQTLAPRVWLPQLSVLIHRIDNIPSIIGVKNFFVWLFTTSCFAIDRSR